MPSVSKIVARISIFTTFRLVFSGLFDGSTQVVNLSPDNFEELVIKDTNHWAVDLYANWCGACQHFAPKWQDLARKYSKEKGVVMFGAIDCAENEDFCRRLGVSKYPQLHVWHFPELSASDKFEGFEIPTAPIYSDVDGWLAGQVPKLHRISPPNLPPPVPAGDGKVAPPPQQIPESLPTEVSVVYHLNDAEVGLLFAFRQSVFLESEKRDIRGETKTVLKSEALSDLLNVLDYLSSHFPSRQACKDLAALATNVRELVKAGDGYLEYSAWSQSLDSRSLDGVPADAGKVPGNYWRLCRTYTCGLWTLFHIMTTMPSTSNGDNSTESLTLVYTFVTRFFGCDTCVEHFSEMYSSCAFDRCKASHMDEKVASMWLWNAHNAVTERVASERNLSSLLWPSAKACPKCWDVDGKAVSDEVYTYLRQSYWSESWRRGGGGRGDATSWTGWIWIGIVLVVCCAFGLIAFASHSQCGMEDQNDARSSFTERLRAGGSQELVLRDDPERQPSS